MSVRVLAPLLILLLAAPLAAQTPTAAGGHELTPASVALLVETTRQPETQQLLAAALTSVNTHVRRVAARVVRSARLTSMRAALVRGLADESAGSLTYDEISRAIESLDGVRPASEAKPREPAGRHRGSALREPVSGKPRVRLWPWLTPALARQLIKETGCRLPEEAPFIVAYVDYHPTGTIARASVEGRGLTDGCKRAGRVLIALTIAPFGHPIIAGVQDVVVIPFDSEYLTCLEGRAKPGKPSRRAQPVRIESGEIVAPEKRRDVRPVYPQGAIDRRIQGVVTLEATITPEGCVQDLDVIESVDPQLDFASLRAVMRWRYSPTLLNGEPVPVIMTVTVNFSLQP